MADASGSIIQRRDDGVYVDGTKVLGVRGNTIANTSAVTNSNNVGNLPATVNSILDAMKAHGLIASA